MSFIIVKESPYIKENNFLLCVPPRHDIFFCVHVGKEVQAWKENILPESPNDTKLVGTILNPLSLHQLSNRRISLHKNLLTEHLGQGYFCGEPNQL